MQGSTDSPYLPLRGAATCRTRPRREKPLRSPLEILPETKFSLVVEKTTVRMLFAIAAYKGVIVMQAEFPNAYLNAQITEDVYFVQPRGLENSNLRQKVCKLNKALYGILLCCKYYKACAVYTMTRCLEQSITLACSGPN